MFDNIFVDMLEKKVSSEKTKLADDISLHRTTMSTAMCEEIKVLQN